MHWVFGKVCLFSLPPHCGQDTLLRRVKEGTHSKIGKSIVAVPLLNYTTEIGVEKTISEIQRCLTKHGATAILTEYERGHITALSFKIRRGAQDISFRLPADWRPVLEILKHDQKVPRRLCTEEQALRVAWRIVKDWVEAQMAIVETKMVTLEQVFLPYVVTKDGRTLYERIRDSQFLLPGPDGSLSETA